MIRQISVFIQNEEGHLAKVLKILGDNDINIRSLTIAETADFGIMRLILQDTEKGLTVLKANKIMANETMVLAVEIPDLPGGMSTFMHLLTESKINIEYAYSFLPKNTSNAVVIFKVNDADKENAVEILKQAEHIHLLDRNTLLMK